MSRFVSAGTNEEPVERDDEWLKAQHELEAERLRKLDEGKQDGGKSLYERLQENNAAKQEAFEEKIKLKNQFRALDDDEAEFLDSVLESTRAQEAAVRKETSEQLDAFRKQQEVAEKAAIDEPDDVDLGGTDDQWATKGKKRKKSHGREGLIGVKLRKTSSSNEHHMSPTRGPTQSAGWDHEARLPSQGQTPPQASGTKSEASSGKTVAPANGLGLGGYSSEDSDGD